MRELTFDDAFWRDVLGALRDPGGAGGERLEERRPGYAELVAELARDARGEPCLVGGRPSTAGKNPRLFLFLTAAMLARRGVEVLYLDLSSELRWLEMLLGEDLKEGLVDHLQYEVRIDRCTRSTAIEGLDVLTGGAYFLAGSPLEDAPAFRAALEGLRERYDAVVVAFPHPFDAAEAAGMPALCRAWIAIEEGEVEAPVTGSERAVVRLTGDPQAAWDLARLSSVFLGPLPAIVAAGGASGAAGEESAPEAGGAAAAGGFGTTEPLGEEPLGEEPGETVEDEEEVAFLRAFEGVVPPASRRVRAAGGESVDEQEAPRERPDSRSEPPRREKAWESGVVPVDEPGWTRGRRGAIAIVAGLVVVAVLAIGLLADRFEPLFAGSDEEPEWAVEWEDGPAPESGTVVALDASGDSLVGEPSGEADEDGAAAGVEAEEGGSPAEIDGRAAPYSLHVGSYQSRESGARVVRSLEAAGQTAFLAPVDLGERGLWYRVYAGAFADSASASAALERVLADDLVVEGAVRRTPWAFRVAVHESREEAEAALAELGIPAYVVGDGPSVIWAGAFRSEDEAATMADALEEAGVDAELDARERPR